MKVTRERYEEILKPAITAIKISTEGSGIIYDLLGISASTASLIRQSEDYEDYKNICRERAERFRENRRLARIRRQKIGASNDR